MELFGYAAERRKSCTRMGVDCVCFGVFGQAVGVVPQLIALWDHYPPLSFLCAILFTLATGVLVGGCGVYAKYHGRNPAWGLVGFFNLPGFLILFCVCAIKARGSRGKGFAVIHAPPYRRDVWRMDVRVIVDAALETGVRNPIMLQVARGASVAAAIKTLAGALPRLDENPISLRCEINGLPADRRDELCAGDELAIFARRGASVDRALLDEVVGVDRA